MKTKNEKRELLLKELLELNKLLLDNITDVAKIELRKIYKEKINRYKND